MIESDGIETAAHGTSMHWLLLTRPSGRAENLALELAELGIQCVYQPLIQTLSCPPSAQLNDELRYAAGLPRRVYVSPAAVEALATLAPGQLGLPAAAVGETTAAQLRLAGCQSIWTAAQGQGIDALFADPIWQSLGAATVALYCAAGGNRPDPARLQALRLKLCAIHVYRRQNLAPSSALIQRLQRHWQSVLLSATSVALMEQLEQLIKQADLAPARARPLLVLSPRIANAAKALGYTDIRPIDKLQVESLRAALAVSQSRG